jgi:hypothetical protein
VPCTPGGAAWYSPGAPLGGGDGPGACPPVHRPQRQAHRALAAGEPRILPIADRSLNGLIGSQVVGDLYRIYVVAERDGIEFNLAHIPEDVGRLPVRNQIDLLPQAAILRRRGGEHMTRIRCFIMLWLLATTVLLPWPPLASAQDSPQAALFKPEELVQLVAPIALYADALLAQILMASTYPLDIVSAARWVKANPNLKDQALENALQAQIWDPSVKSLVAFPQVLTMLNEKLDWTQKLGDAFLAQQKDVMDTVQRLRAKAQAQGNLITTSQQKVIVEQPAGSQTTVVKIEPASPQVVYIPTYNPTVVYGGWPYPAYPPYAYYPPGYVAATSLMSFGVGALDASPRARSQPLPPGERLRTGPARLQHDAPGGAAKTPWRRGSNR